MSALLEYKPYHWSLTQNNQRTAELSDVCCKVHKTAVYIIYKWFSVRAVCMYLFCRDKCVCCSFNSYGLQRERKEWYLIRKRNPLFWEGENIKFYSLKQMFYVFPLYILGVFFILVAFSFCSLFCNPLLCYITCEHRLLWCSPFNRKGLSTHPKQKKDITIYKSLYYFLSSTTQHV